MKTENKSSSVNKGYLNFFIIFWLGVLTGALAVGLALVLNGYSLKDTQASLFNWSRINRSQSIPTPPGGIVDSIPTPPGGIVSIPTPPGGIVQSGSTFSR